MTEKPRRSPCPVSCTLDLIGDKWTLLVVRDLLLGKTQFREFAQSPEGIATNILTDRLERLVTHGLVERRESETSARRPTYHLTKKGRTLEPLVRELKRWGLAQIEGTAALLKPKP